jgi:hypothetical protein
MTRDLTCDLISLGFRESVCRSVIQWHTTVVMIVARYSVRLAYQQLIVCQYIPPRLLRTMSFVRYGRNYRYYHILALVR